MRIAFVVDSLATGGAERLVVDLAAEAVRRQHNVKIVAISNTDGIPLQAAAEAGLAVEHLNLSLKNPSAIRAIRRSTRDADLVHVHLFPALYWAAFAGRPLIFTEHSTWNRRQKGAVAGILDRIAYSRYERVIAISPGVALATRELFRRRRIPTLVSEIPNGVSREFFLQCDRRGETSSVLRLVGIGSLKPVKAFNDAISAVAKLDNVVLDLVGDGPMRASLERQVDDLGVEDRVRILGPRVDVPRLLCNYDALLSTSRYEGFGLVAAEAMATGMPVIGPDVPGFNDVVLKEETGILYNPADGISGISAAIQRMQDPGLRRKFGIRAREHAQQFSIETAFERHEALYREVIAGSLR